MKQDNHAATPGPWYSWLPQNCDEGCRDIRTEKGRMHGTYGGTTVAATVGLRDDKIDKANARLIAAAPSLLLALEDLIGDLPDMKPPDDSCNFIVCRHCGREYSSYDDLPPPKTALDCSDDCPGHIARAAITKAKGD